MATGYEQGVDAWCLHVVPPNADTVAEATADERGPVSLPTIRTDEDLDTFLVERFGIKLPNVACCPTHSTPWVAFHDAYFARSPVAVWKASRGFGGKSFTLALLALTEALTLKADVNVLGGSGEQSKRVLESMESLWASPNAPRDHLIGEPNGQRQRLIGGNVIKALKASQTSVRGPHPQRLRLDECLAAGTRIATPSGWRNIEDLTAGDELYCDHEGAIKVGRITTVWDRGRRDTVRLEFSNGAVIRSTPEHPIKTTQGWQRADQAEDAKAVSGLWFENDTNGTAGRGLYGLLQEEIQAQGVRVRKGQGVTFGWLRDVLSQAQGACDVVLRRLRRAAESWWREAMSFLPPGMDVRIGSSQVCGGQGERLWEFVEPSRIPGARVVDTARSRLEVAGADRALGSGSSCSRDARDRSARRILARPAGGQGEGRTEAGSVGSRRNAGGRAANGPDAFVVQTVGVSDREVGGFLPVYDLATTFGTYIAEGIIVHNCDEMKRSILESALGQPMSKGWVLSQVVLSSTHQYPNGTMTWALQEAASKGWPIFEWCLEETKEPHGWLTQGEIDRKRSIMTTAAWDTEVLLQEPSAEGRAIVPECVAAAFVEGLELEGPQPGGEYGTGADWAKKVNHTVVPTIRNDVTPARVVAVERTQRKPWPIMAKILNDRVELYGGSACHDNAGVGGVVADLLEVPQGRIEHFNFTGRERNEMLSEYIAALETGKLVWPRDDRNLALKAAYTEHLYSTVADVFGRKEEGHLPDTISAGALAWRACKAVVAVSAVQQDDGDATQHLRESKTRGRLSGFIRGGHVPTDDDA